MEVELLIQNGKKVYIPVVEEGIAWSTERKGSPGQLTFKVVKDGILNFTVIIGNHCTFNLWTGIRNLYRAGCYNIVN